MIHLLYTDAINGRMRRPVWTETPAAARVSDLMPMRTNLEAGYTS